MTVSFTVQEVLLQCLSSISGYHIAQSHEFRAIQAMTNCSPPPTMVMTIGTHSDLISEDDYVKIDKEMRQSIKSENFGKIRGNN